MAFWTYIVQQRLRLCLQAVPETQGAVVRGKTLLRSQECTGRRGRLRWHHSIAADLLLSQAGLPAHHDVLVRAGTDRLRSREGAALSFEIIIPFLKPIASLLLDQTISEIMVNPDGSVWTEKDGRIQCCLDIQFDDGALLTGLEVIANRFGKKLDADSPILNLRLPDGSRMAALVPPVVNPSPMMTIRRFTAKGYTIHDLIERKALTEAEADILAEHVRRGDNVLISGSTSSGKTTLANRSEERRV